MVQNKEHTEMDPTEMQTRARAALSLERNPDFDTFKKFLEDQADINRQLATDADAQNQARRLQLLDMAKGLDDVLEFWAENVENALELLEGEPEEPEG